MSETTIDAELARRLVASQFPHWAGLPVRPVAWDGWDNRTFRLGETMTIRLPSAERYVTQVHKEQRWLPVLGRHLPLPIPTPLGLGSPGHGYPWPWSVYGWIEGETAANERIADKRQFAIELAQFLLALHRIDVRDGPPAGPLTFFRGGSLAVYDTETRTTLEALGKTVDSAGALAVWEAALAAEWHNSPVWVHGDIAVGNLLVRDGRLSAVIDFGGCCVGDPACDLVIAWTFLEGESREAFRATVQANAGTWARARGWALWKALITLARNNRAHPAEASPQHIIAAVIADR